MTRLCSCPELGLAGGSYADFGCFLTIKSVSDPYQSTNRKRIDSFRNNLVSFGKVEPTIFYAFEYAVEPNYNGNLEYKWTITCVLVVLNTKKNTANNGNHYKCGEC